MDRRKGARAFLLQSFKLSREDGTTTRVLVPEIDPDLADAGGPRGDQHALEEAVRVALEDPAVLERAGLAFVDVDRHDARFRLRRHQAPLATRGEARPAQAAQPGVFHDLGDLLARSLAGEAVRDQLVAARF